MNQFILKKSHEKAGPGYHLRVIEKKATLQDLLDEMDEFISNGGLPRIWPENIDNCKGCHLCCHEPLPLTSIDVHRICRGQNCGFIQAFNYLNIEIQGRMADITLKRPGGSCIFLDKKGICKIYYNRPFSCHVYICCHVPDEIRELYSQVVNQGMDELVRLVIAEFKKTGISLPATGGSIKALRPGDWRPNCFTGKQDYDQLRLQDVLSSALMKVLLV